MLVKWPDLLVHESNSGDLLHHGLGRRPPVPEVGGDGDGQLAPELLALETLKKKNESIISSNLKVTLVNFVTTY